MKFRSLILVCCMVVVPGLAMFSHHLPAVRLRHLLTAALQRPERATVPAVADGPPAPAASPQVVPDPAPEPPRGGGVGDSTGFRAAVSRPPDPAATPVAAAPTRAAHARLAALGATAIDCQPDAAAGGTVLCSCRVAVDPSGQLQRLFQVTAVDEPTALAALADDVAAWRRRTAGP